MHSDLAVIIVSWNVRDLLLECLTSLKAALASDGVDATVLVVDNASADGTVDAVRGAHPWTRVEALGSNLGFVGANNLGLDLVGGTAGAYWLLNPDTVVPPNTPARMLAFLRTHADAGLIGPRLLNPDGSFQECAFRFPGVAQVLFALGAMPTRLYFTRLNGRYARSLYERNSAFRVDHPLGAAMMANAAAVEAVGPMDAGFFMYCEEIDWAWRMRKAGWTSWLLPDATVTHIGGASAQQARPEAMRYLWESRARLYRKHRGAVTRLLARAAVRRVFASTRAQTADPSWAAAYDGILNAWT
ncbi:MAG: glycosyltransferase family 2 protein [Anaerolineae bacterium]|jgi:hypothetical protein|nr:glycosyltransferase family 2 protein [Anaerolineae bacterium]